MEKKNAVAKSNSDINKSNLIINQETGPDSEENKKAKTSKTAKKECIVNDDSDEDDEETGWHEGIGRFSWYAALNRLLTH